MAKRKLEQNDTVEQADDLDNVVSQSVCRVKRTFTKNGQIVAEDDDVEYIAVHKFVTAPAETGVTYGSTINLGNYEAARIDVWCKVPAYREELEAAFEFAKNFADSKMKEEMDGIGKSKNKKQKDLSPF